MDDLVLMDTVVTVPNLYTGMDYAEHRILLAAFLSRFGKPVSLQDLQDLLFCLRKLYFMVIGNKLMLTDTGLIALLRHLRCRNIQNWLHYSDSVYSQWDVFLRRLNDASALNSRIFTKGDIWRSVLTVKCPNVLRTGQRNRFVRHNIVLSSSTSSCPEPACPVQASLIIGRPSPREGANDEPAAAIASLPGRRVTRSLVAAFGETADHAVGVPGNTTEPPKKKRIIVRSVRNLGSSSDVSYLRFPASPLVESDIVRSRVRDPRIIWKFKLSS
eukprot:ANDGO_06593.mRNA.1 hypothetical protein